MFYLLLFYCRTDRQQCSLLFVCFFTISSLTGAQEEKWYRKVDAKAGASLPDGVALISLIGVHGQCQVQVSSCSVFLLKNSSQFLLVRAHTTSETGKREEAVKKGGRTSFISPHTPSFPTSLPPSPLSSPYSLLDFPLIFELTPTVVCFGLKHLEV